MKKKNRSKHIGNNFERLVSKLLSKWLTGSDKKDVAWRDLSSGARATNRKKEGLETARSADIVCTDLAYQYFFNKFFIDTKSYQEINLLFINNKNQKSNDILREWKKVCNDCPKDKIPMMPVQIRDKKTPMLLFLPTYVILPMTNQTIPYVNYNFYDDTEDFNVYLLDTFFKEVNPEQFYERNRY